MALNLRCGTAGVNEFSATIQTFGRAPWLANQASGDLDSGGAVSHLRHQGGSSSLSVDSGIAAMILGCVMQAILHSGGTGTRRSQTPSAAAWPRVSSVRRRTSHPSFRSVFLWPAAVAGGSGMAAPGAICPGQRHASAFGTKPRDFPAVPRSAAGADPQPRSDPEGLANAQPGKGTAPASPGDGAGRLIKDALFNHIRFFAFAKFRILARLFLRFGSPHSR